MLIGILSPRRIRKHFMGWTRRKKLPLNCLSSGVLVRHYNYHSNGILNSKGSSPFVCGRSLNDMIKHSSRGKAGDNFFEVLKTVSGV
ncbi:hypothetical protein CDAR_7911 [Caerostris darwini]|uniref:Uncharacterized protein n=1 Tax=Caerostris darwini TaxID=1538125 RepID=A0AAV4QD47_9ARAC|nr:hypothetical protein CDAR_7911 [Caerostris darwini]